MSQAFLQQLLDKVLNWEVVDGYSVDKSNQLLKWNSVIFKNLSEHRVEVEELVHAFRQQDYMPNSSKCG
ncbi:hypothetical protein OIU74_025811 [Salix koriyanagi]|uniref:Uncharacterized protein n=1 Tax=Salix koriyanagi TaxID=2511006 RepID=A0A9Q0W2Y1_9ROSI|nr:hypothetical protein OIU74_025811 [Salix koriyanagi]